MKRVESNNRRKKISEHPVQRKIRDCTTWFSRASIVKQGIVVGLVAGIIFTLYVMATTQQQQQGMKINSGPAPQKPKWEHPAKPTFEKFRWEGPSPDRKKSVIN